MRPEVVDQGGSTMDDVTVSEDKETRKMRIQKLLEEHQEMLVRLEQDKKEKAALLLQAQQELAKAKEESENVRRLLEEATQKAQQAKIEEEKLQAEEKPDVLS